MPKFFSAAVLWIAALGPPQAQAHPMGNLGISHYSALTVGTRAVTVQYVLDFAEIPAFQEIQRHRLVTEGTHASVSSYVLRMEERLAGGLTLSVGQTVLALTPAQRCAAAFTPGAAGMVTMRISCQFTAKVPAQSAPFLVRYRDDNFAQRSGWKEIILNAAPDAKLISASVPQRDRSAALTRYPATLLSAAPQILDAQAVLQALGATLAKN